MVDYARIFRGASEVSFKSLRWSKNSSVVVDEAMLVCIPTSNITSSTVLDITRKDGSTKAFSGKVVNIKDKREWEVKLFTNGYELQNKFVEKVYTNATPEGIVQDVINNFTNNLTYASTVTSGFTIPKYIAKAYAADVVAEMMRILRWRLRIDQNDNVYFEPHGHVDNGIILTHGTNFEVLEWQADATQMVNNVRIEGGFQSFVKEETVSGTGTTFALTKKPSGSMRAAIGATEVDPSEYTVFSEDKYVEFASSQTNPTFKYEYKLPIIVLSENSESIIDHEEIYKEFRAPGVNNITDVRKLANNLVAEKGTPPAMCKGVIPFLDFDADVNQTVTVKDTRRGITEQLVIERIDWNAEDNTTTIYFGNQSYDFLGWQQEVQENIKQLIRTQRNDEGVTFARAISHDLHVSMRHYVRPQVCYSTDNQYTVGHVTLGRITATINHEADCSDNGNGGLWQGSGIDGNQFIYHRHLHGSGRFNGSDNYIDAEAQITMTGNRSVVYALRPDSLVAQPLASQLGNDAGDFSFEISDSSGHLKFRRWTGTSDAYEEWTTTSLAVSASEWQTVAAVYNGTDVTFYKATSAGVTSESPTKTTGNETQSAANLFCGRSDSSYYDGDGDEFKIFDTTLTSADVEDCHDGTFDDAHAKYGNCDLWWSMDNPQLGERSTCSIWAGTSGGLGYVHKEYIVDLDYVDHYSTTATVNTEAHTVTFS